MHSNAGDAFQKDFARQVFPRDNWGHDVSGWTSSKFGLRQIFSGGIILVAPRMVIHAQIYEGKPTKLCYKLIEKVVLDNLKSFHNL